MKTVNRFSHFGRFGLKTFSLMLLSLMVQFTSLLSLSSCSGSEDSSVMPQEVAFVVDYSFAQSGNMTRATGAEVYDAFYDKYIKTKQLTPKTFSLTFKHKESGAVTNITNGLWSNNDVIRLVEGEYEVTGTSAPLSESDHVLGNSSDTVYLKFNEVVNITKDMTKVNLTAIYDSYLLMFDNTNYKKACIKNLNYNAKDLIKTDSNYIVFIKRLFDNNGSINENFIQLTRNDNSAISIELDKQPFEKGKYYYFNDMTNSFDIPKMESGN